MTDMGKSLVLLRTLCLAALAALAVQSCENTEGYRHGTDGVTARSIDMEQSCGSSATNFEFKFTARADWTAESDNPSMLTITTAASGSKGRTTMNVAVAENTSGKERTGRIIISVEGCESEILLSVTQSNTDHPDFAANRESDRYLSEYYLWNDEYNTLTRNLSQDYDAFVENTLLAMSTNTEDGGTTGGKRHLYSFIERSKASRSVLEKESETTFGIFNLAAVMLVDQNGKDTGSRALCVLGVYPGTPAAEAGIKRGTWIFEAGGAEINSANINGVYESLIYPSAAGKSMKLTVMDEYKADAEEREVALTSADMPLNPVLCSKIIERGAARIGYLVYGDFEASFDDELLAEIRKFKSAGITDMVLDLRVNGGGHVISAQMLASVIAGTEGDGKDCLRYEYNADRMKNMGYSYPDNLESMKFGADAAPKGHMSEYSKADYLSLERLFVLVTGRTASASELTFTALRGIDFPVTLIGERTEGKNVGMEPYDFECGGYEYLFYPITFRYYNAKNQTCDPAGTVPDYEVTEWDNGYCDWGSASDPLLARALEVIAGPSKSQATRSVQEVPFRPIPASESNLKRAPRRGGIIAPARVRE